MNQEDEVCMSHTENSLFKLQVVCSLYKNVDLYDVKLPIMCCPGKIQQGQKRGYFTLGVNNSKCGGCVFICPKLFLFLGLELVET